MLWWYQYYMHLHATPLLHCICGHLTVPEFVEPDLITGILQIMTCFIHTWAKSDITQPFSLRSWHGNRSVYCPVLLTFAFWIGSGLHCVCEWGFTSWYWYSITLSVTPIQDRIWSGVVLLFPQTVTLSGIKYQDGKLPVASDSLAPLSWPQRDLQQVGWFGQGSI